MADSTKKTATDADAQNPPPQRLIGGGRTSDGSEGNPPLETLDFPKDSVVRRAPDKEEK